MAAPLSALEGELGRLARPDGRYSTEISRTVTDPRLNNGRATNIPLLVYDQIDVPGLLAGKPVTREQELHAIQRALERTIGGKSELPSYDSTEEAVEAAKRRSGLKGQTSRRNDMSTLAAMMSAIPAATQASGISASAASGAASAAGMAKAAGAASMFGSGGGMSRGFGRMGDTIANNPTANPLDVLFSGMPTKYQDNKLAQILHWLIKGTKITPGSGGGFGFDGSAGGGAGGQSDDGLEAMLKKLMGSGGGGGQMPVTTIGGPGGGSSFRASPPTPGPLSMRGPSTGLGKFF